MKKIFMNIKTKYLVILLLILILLAPSVVYANRGMMVIGPMDVDLQESGQNAIVAFNGNEEVIILSTDVSSSESTLVLEVIPLPSNPNKVEEGSFDSFEKLIEIIQEKIETMARREMTKGRGVPEEAALGVEITFHKKMVLMM